MNITKQLTALENNYTALCQSMTKIEHRLDIIDGLVGISSVPEEEEEEDIPEEDEDNGRYPLKKKHPDAQQYVIKSLSEEDGVSLYYTSDVKRPWNSSINKAKTYDSKKAAKQALTDAYDMSLVGMYEPGIYLFSDEEEDRNA